MKRSLLLTLAGAGCLFSALAAPVSPEEALRRAGANTRGADPRLAFTSRQTNGEAAVYVFDNGADNGFMILSADDCAAPVLGYADSGSFKADEMPPDMKWWIGEYGRQIEYAVSKGAGEYVSTTTRAGRKSIAPMIKTKWNQSAPYNNMTPEVNGRHCVTGCVATSTAQVVNFWKYPTQASGTATAQVLIDGEYETVTMNMAERKFDWDNMLDSYADVPSTQAQKDAVAYLMKACGYSARMNYTSGESGASSFYAAEGLVKYFGYNKNLLCCSRDNFSFYDWDDMVYGELAAGRPIVYGGSSLQGGHSFVCDGYDATSDMYHFNWGWGGMSDGYFALNALNPSDLGIGANGGGYNFFQDIIIGVQPTETGILGSQVLLQGLVSGSKSGNVITMNVPGLFNYAAHTLNFSLGAMIEPENGGTATYVTNYQHKFDDLSAPAGSGWKDLNPQFIMSTSLPDGTYKMTLCYQEFGREEWIPVLAEQTEYNYLLVTKKGTTYTPATNKEINIKVEKADVVGELVYGQLATLEVTISNPTERELTKSVYPVLCSGTKAVMTMDGLTIDLEPGETKTVTMSGQFDLISGASAPTTDTSYRLRFFDPSVYSYASDPANLTFYPNFTKDVVMTKGEDPKLIVTDFDMPGLTYTVNGTGKDKFRLYTLKDYNELPFTCTVKNEGGYYGNVIMITLFKSVTGSTSMPYYADAVFTTVAAIDKNGTQTFTQTFTGINLEDGFYAACPYDSSYNLLKDTNGQGAELYFTVDRAAVDELTAETGIKVSYNRGADELLVNSASAIDTIDIFTLNGAKCWVDTKTTAEGRTSDLSSLPAGVFLVKITTIDGKSCTVKVVK